MGAIRIGAGAPLSGSKIFVGDQPVKAVAVGDTIIWQLASPIVVGETSQLPNGTFSYLRRPLVWQKPTQVSTWWNAYKQRWDGVIPTTQGTDAHKVFKDLLAPTPTVTTQLDTRTTVRADCWWDHDSKKLFVLSSHHLDSYFYRLSYDEVADTYTVDPGFPVVMPDEISVSQVDGSRNHDWPVVLYRTPNGTLWAACTASHFNGAVNRRLAVARSTDGGATWSTPINLDPTSQNGCTTIGHIVEDGVTKLVVMTNWNDEGATHGWDGYIKAWSIDSNAADISPSNWDTETLPPAKGTEWSDDHASSVSYNNKIYVAVKTTPNQASDPQILILVREPNTGWTSYPVAVQGVDDPTRPAIVIDATFQRIIVTWGELNPLTARIRYKAAPLNDLASLETAEAVTVMEGAAAGRNFELGANLPRNTLTESSGVLVLAADSESLNIFRATLSL